MTATSPHVLAETKGGSCGEGDLGCWAGVEAAIAAWTEGSESWLLAGGGETGPNDGLVTAYMDAPRQANEGLSATGEAVQLKDRGACIGKAEKMPGMLPRSMTAANH